MGYKLSAFKGLTWMGFLRISVRGITFVRLAILARILTPSQFGVFGIATLLLSFIETVTETGINVFLIQRKENISEYLNSAWIISIVRGIIITCVIVVISPLVVRFFNSPESLNVILLISLVPFIRGFINPSIINIQKEIQFHKEFYLRATLLIIDSIVAIVVAFVTKSAESMALGLIVSALVEVLLSFLIFKSRPKISVEIYKVIFIIRNSWWFTLIGVFAYLSENLDNIVVGRILGSESLGIYQNSYKLSTVSVSEITEVINKVTFPVYSKFSGDKDRLIKAFNKVFISSTSLALLVGITIFIFANQIVMILLGDQWLSAIPIVKILAIYGIFRTMFGNFSAMFISANKQIYVALTTFVRLVSLVIIIVPLVNSFGMMGAGIAMLISIFSEIPIIIYFYFKIKK